MLLSHFQLSFKLPNNFSKFSILGDLNLHPLYDSTYRTVFINILGVITEQWTIRRDNISEVFLHG